MRLNKSAPAVIVAIALSSSVWAAIANASTVYDANAAYVANETNVSTQTNPSFGPFTVGYGNTLNDGSLYPSTFTPFTSSQFTSAFVGNANTSGFYVHNNVSVPAALVDVSPTNPGFAGMAPGQILLHPGGIGANGFDEPVQNAVLEFTVPTTGSYLIAGDFQSLDTGAKYGEIGLNGGSAFFTATIPANSTGSTYPFSFTENLTAGSKLDFAVREGPAGIASNSTGLFATITAVPEPSAWACSHSGRPVSC